MLWSALLRLDPGAAVARWMLSHVGDELEEEGPNKGAKLRRWMPYELAVDSQPYCAALLAAVLDAAGAVRIAPRGRHWFWSNRAAKTWEAGHKRAGVWAGPLVPPAPGWLCFWDRRTGSDTGTGGHVDIVTEYDAGERVITLVGGNLGDTIKMRERRIGYPGITGFGIPRRAAA